MNGLETSGPPEIAWPALAAVALITLVATAAHWWLKRRGLIPAAASNPIKLVATRSLGAKRQVAIIEVESQRFLLGLTDETVSLLSPLASEAKPTATMATSSVVSLPLGVAR